MERGQLIVIAAGFLAGILILAGFWFAWSVYSSQENCQQMDQQRHITANCWAFPSKFLVAGGVLLGLGGTGLLLQSIRWYRDYGTKASNEYTV